MTEQAFQFLSYLTILPKYTVKPVLRGHDCKDKEMWSYNKTGDLLKEVQFI
jgi:hypothetical protein